MKLPTLTSSQALRQAETLASQGDFEQATRLYNAVLTQDPTNKKAKKGLRDLQKRSGSSLTMADFERIEAYRKAGRIDAASSEARRLCKLHPEQPAIHNLRGVVLAESKRGHEAIDAFKTALQLEPGFSEALRNIASVYADGGYLNEALNCYQELLKRGESSADLYNSLGVVFRTARRYNDALEAFRRAVSLDPDFTNAYNNLGNVLNDLERHDEAIGAYDEAIARDNTHEQALINRAQSLNTMLKSNLALKDLYAYREAYGDTRTTLTLRANALLFLQQKTAAVEALEELLAMEPDSPMARHMLAALGGKTQRVADPSYARDVFQSYAARFEKHLTEQLEYKLPERIPGLLKRLDGENAWYERVLDIGCGTGLVGAQIRAFCTELTGIDVSPAMVDKAGEKAVYDELAAADVSTWLAESDVSFDLAICADMLVYVGAVDELFRAIAQHLVPGGRLIASTEQSATDDLILRDTGRYAHSEGYMRRAAENAGLKVTAHSAINLRRERGHWLEGGLFVFTRPQAPTAPA